MMQGIIVSRYVYIITYTTDSNQIFFMEGQYVFLPVSKIQRCIIKVSARALQCVSRDSAPQPLCYGDLRRAVPVTLDPALLIIP